MAIETFRPGIRTGSLAPWRAGGLVGNHLSHSSLMAAKSSSSAMIRVALTALSRLEAGGLEDGRDVAQALGDLLAGRPLDDLAAGRVDGRRAGDEDQARGPDRLAVGRGRGGGRVGEDDVARHGCPRQGWPR
jgi:hypothetical protein